MMEQDNGELSNKLFDWQENQKDTIFKIFVLKRKKVALQKILKWFKVKSY